MENKKSSGILRDCLLIIISIILSVSGIIVANNYGLIHLGKATTTNQTSTIETSLTQTIEKIRKCSVSVFCQLGTVDASAGSGVILRYDSATRMAYVITNHHVVNDIPADKYQVLLSGSASLTDATLVGTDPENDIAVLRFQTTTAPEVASVGRSLSDLSVGEQVIAIGNPYGVYYDTVTEGIISTIGRVEDMNGIEKLYIQTSADINPGNSGGGLYDINGTLLAINTLSISSANGMSFSFPLLYDHTVSTSNTTYNIDKRDALTSFNCLLRKHSLLVDAGRANTIGYIESQKTVGATFETYTITEKDYQNKDIHVDNVYVDNAYSFFEVETGSAEWSEPTAQTNTTATYDFIQKVEVSSNKLSWQVATLGAKTLEHDADAIGGVKEFSAVDLMDYMRASALNTYFRFTITVHTLDSSVGSLTPGVTKTVIAKLIDFTYTCPTD